MKPAPPPTWDPAPSLDQVIPLIFDELRAMASRQLAREHDNITLHTTDLVHEAYIRLAGDRAVVRRRARNSKGIVHRDIKPENILLTARAPASSTSESRKSPASP